MSTMRDKMPATTAFVDALREAFGRDEVDATIKAGMRDGTFWAVEGVHVVGRPQSDMLSRVHFIPARPPGRCP